jgi:PA domain
MFLILYLQVALASISIYSPESLKKRFSKGIKGSLGNFGNPPYNTSIIGSLWYPGSDQGCSPFSTNPFSTEENLIVMMDRGGCAFVVKVKHAQDIGAKSVIIANTIPGENIENFTMRDNGLGGNLFISAFIISFEDSEAIKDTLKTLSVSLVLNFEMSKSVGAVKFELWMSSVNDLSLRFLREFESTGKQLTKLNCDFTPYYVFIRCLSCDTAGYNSPHVDCLGGGRYCAPDPDGNGPISGRMVIQEDLRQLCMFEQMNDDVDYSRWFLFQSSFSKKCVLDNFTPECSENIMAGLGFDIKTLKKCYQSSFIGGKEDEIVDNTRLAEQSRFWHSTGFHFYPTIIINHQQFRGDMEKSAVVSGICAGYQIKYQPEFCKSQDPAVPVYNEGYSTGVVIGGLVIFFGILVVILLVYRYLAKKELQKEMRTQVNSAVSQYFALSDTSTFKKSNRAVVKGSFV